MKKKLSTPPTIHKPQGFSILEFLVASILSMIVLMAISSSYFTARNLNSAATSRLAVQQDLRNAATMITRDARMAGSFGCFNMTGSTTDAIKSDVKDNVFSIATSGQTVLIPIKEIKADELSVSDFQAKSNAIVFQYGIESAIASATTGVVSNCSLIATGFSDDIDSITAARSVLGASSNLDGSLSIMTHVVNAYAVGTANNITGLFRLQLDNNGSWGNPQLLVKNVTNMDTHYIYVTPNSCPETATTGGGTDETFDYVNDLATGNNATTPALIRLTLNGSINAEGDTTNTVTTYNIDATIRGGNTCADRTL